MLKVNYLLKGKRVSINKTQTELAKYLGLHKSAYAMKERGTRRFTLPEVEKLAVLFELSPMEVIQIFLPELFTQMEQKKSA
jgi:transcriptional regulator with XRE-family HTH domain